MFHDVQELSGFARSILVLPLGHDLSSYASMDELTDNIIEAFKQSDHIKQALFMQALERRADEKKDSQFQKYFEAWEKQIGR
jgi:hypothetical protein